MITYYNHPHMTAVPTRLLLDTNLSAEAKFHRRALVHLRRWRSECSGAYRCSDPSARKSCSGFC